MCFQSNSKIFFLDWKYHSIILVYGVIINIRPIKYIWLTKIFEYFFIFDKILMNNFYYFLWNFIAKHNNLL